MIVLQVENPNPNSLFIVEVDLALKLVYRYSTLKQTAQVENANWPETNQLAMYKRSRRIEPRTTWNKSS